MRWWIPPASLAVKHSDFVVHLLLGHLLFFLGCQIPQDSIDGGYLEDVQTVKIVTQYDVFLILF